MLKLISDRLQFDRSLQWVLLTRLWHTLSGPVTIALVIGMMSLSEQGLYYGLISVVGIQAFFELGLPSVLVTQASHEFAAGGATRLQQSPAKTLARLQALLESSRTWFARAALVYVAVGLALGIYTFWTEESSDWIWPLVWLILGSALSVALTPSVAFLEAVGYREDVYLFRFLQFGCGSFVVWLGLMLGAGLWVLPLSSAVQALWTWGLIHWRHRDVFSCVRDAAAEQASFSWIEEVLPIQWRMAAISLVCHVATQFFTIIIIRFWSADLAAPLGTTLSVTSAIGMLAMAWGQTKFPLISQYHGAGDRERAGTLWRQVSLLSTTLMVLGLAALLVILLGLPLLETWVGKSLQDRFLTPSQLLIYAAGNLLIHLVTLQGMYVLAQKRNPLTAATVIGFGILAISVWAGGYWGGVDGLLIAYTVTVAAVTFPVHTLAYLRLRKQLTV
ncbi:MAG: hypothetical protein CBB71_22820 [Rhodopirellula sp. TMED11]|nr:MAG: hypothetical protein CBB71_22820 [Rhodopirellula sp. TMED11]